MKIIIKNPAPMDYRQKKWGDYHFGRCLSKYLSRLGAKVETHYKPAWDNKNKSDAVIVLRGKYPYSPPAGPINIVWIISHPGSAVPEECNEYDYVCVASYRHADILKKIIRVPIFPLLQCTDIEEFYPPPRDNERRGVIFVGNTRGVPRNVISWALEYGLPLELYGRGWADYINRKHVIKEYVENSVLGQLYGKARFTLNDHWNDMKSLGYINNRIFDALACGLPIISDYHEELDRLFPGFIPFFQNQEEFYNCLEKMYLMYPNINKKIASLQKKIRDEYSFESRAKFIYDLIISGNRNKIMIINSRVEKKNKENDLNKHYTTKTKFVENIKKNFQNNKKVKFCPMCGSFFEMFLSFGSPKRKNAKCPSCGSLERHRLFWSYFQSQLCQQLKSGTKHLLHLAPEEHLTRLLQKTKDIDYISADLNSPYAMIRLDLNNIDLPDFRFDIIVCSHILEHISDDYKAISELYRVTKNRGFLIVQVPVYGDTTFEDPNIKTPEERKNAFGQVGRVRKYDFDLEKRLEKHGFKVKIINLYKEYGSELSKFLGIKNQVLFECQKLL